ncbi:MAG: DNA integrity scanning protein DisA nucleotide-binding domain protein [Deltaproteobacteria bacterium]|nr:DNA integrity scanning protein DisA nucleotide-binding domain protein [Deltaproteobacteria bacterium]
MRKSNKQINRELLQSAVRLAAVTHASALFIYLDPVKEHFEELLQKNLKTFFLTRRTEEDIQSIFPEGAKVPLIHLAKIDMTRMGQIQMAIVLALSKQMIRLGEKLIFATGRPESDILDSIIFVDTARESELMTSQAVEGLTEEVRPDVFQQILNIALELASRGREGKPVGTIFVLGDEQKVLQLSKQMIINPFKGYTDEERNILNPALRDTLFEFAALDGAFIISHDGLVLSAGRHLGTAGDEDTIPRGLGSRHIAAAGITSLTDAVALVISESTGDLRIFKNGKILMKIEKPTRPTGG